MKCVCSIDAYEEVSEEISTTKPKARIEHACGECHEAIAPGEQYERFVGNQDGGLFTAKTCLPCAEVRDCFCCTYGFGLVWDHIHDNVWDLELCVLDSLSPEAREKFFEEFGMERLEGGAE